MTCEVVTTRGGARALRHLASGEVMHPGLGPAVESRELYVLPSRLEERLRAGSSSDPPLVLFDVGLGAASNAIAAFAVSEALPSSARRLEIVSFENDLESLRLALQPDNAEAFGLAREGENAAARDVLERGRHETARTTWRLAFGDFLVCLAAEPEASADVVFWDMFSRGANPPLWTVTTFRALWTACREGATFHTYSAATSTRSGLLLAGFAVGVGDPTGDKAETTVAAMRVADLVRPLDVRWLIRLARSSAAFPTDVPPGAEQAAATLAQIKAMPQFATAHGSDRTSR